MIPRKHEMAFWIGVIIVGVIVWWFVWDQILHHVVIK